MKQTDLTIDRYHWSIYDIIRIQWSNISYRLFNRLKKCDFINLYDKLMAKKEMVAV